MTRNFTPSQVLSTLLVAASVTIPAIIADLQRQGVPIDPLYIAYAGTGCTIIAACCRAILSHNSGTDSGLPTGKDEKAAATAKVSAAVDQVTGNTGAGSAVQPAGALTGALTEDQVKQATQGQLQDITGQFISSEAGIVPVTAAGNASEETYPDDEAPPSPSDQQPLSPAAGSVREIVPDWSNKV